MRDDSLFYTCSLIEYIGRKKCLERAKVVRKIGKENLKRIYKYSDVLHCEPIEKISDEYIKLFGIRKGKFDNIKSCKYLVPGYWDIGDVYSRLISDVSNGDIIDTLIDVYNSKLSTEISDFNSAMFFQPRDYLKECYLNAN